MAGKGSKLRKGANLNNYWDNYPFPEKNTVLNWSDKFGDKIIDKVGFRDLPVGVKITEDEYTERLSRIPDEPDTVMTVQDINELKDTMNSMSFSEFKKITKQ
jgi:hypothetical protein